MTTDNSTALAAPSRPMSNYLDSLEADALSEIENVGTTEALESWRRKYVGVNGAVKDAMRYVVDERPEHRQAYLGQLERLRNTLWLRMSEVTPRISQARKAEQLIPV